MADADEKVFDNRGLAGAIRQTTTELNGLIAQFRLLLAKLDADATVTDTDYESTLDTGYAVIVDQAGNTL